MGTVRVAVADDDPGVLDVMRLFFSAGGFELVGTASDGRAAIELVRSTRPDVLVLDLDMPGMGGHEVAPVLRAEQPGLGMVIYSAGAEHVSERTSRLVDAIVAKTDSLQALVEAVLTVASRRQLPPEA